VATLSLPYASAATAALTGETTGGGEQAGHSQLRAVNKRVNGLARQTEHLDANIHETRTVEDVILIPIALLVSILAAGGILGVVYSVREQRRTGQLHELTVGGEIASQRRSEQSYGSFFEQSQTTLSLVNDTLELAKEATDQAARSMELKAKSRIKAIEERAQKLMFDVFGEREFELIINDPARRAELHSIADELRSLEGYLSLQDIKLLQHTKFVKAIDQFLLGDTESAVQALRLASQDRVAGDLQSFTEYWLGYMLTTVAEYDEAVAKFRHDEIDLKKSDPEYFQLERIIAETEFFVVAKNNAQSELESKKITSPPKRFKSVAKLLDRLTKLDRQLAKSQSQSQSAKQHTALEIARTRADIYEWIAYDPRHLDDPLKEGPLKRTVALLKRHPEVKKIKETKDLLSSPAWKELSKPNDFRAWALWQARAICEEQKESSLDVDFALAECLFKLGDKEADSAFESAERALQREFGELHEKRRSATIQQSVLICHTRLLKLSGNDKSKQKESGQVVLAERGALDVVKDMRQGRVTIFSQIQRRNVTQDEFKEEVKAIADQILDKDKR
jgi:hypothetical protein